MIGTSFFGHQQLVLLGRVTIPVRHLSVKGAINQLHLIGR